MTLPAQISISVFSNEFGIIFVFPVLVIGPVDDYAPPIQARKDKLQGGLLAGGFNEASCISRYQSVLYRKESLHKASPYLILRLRSYEALHKRCGPYTKSYNKTLEKLKTGDHLESTDCNYLVWISFSGLGNRILTLASAFLYALMNHVLLVDPGDMVDLFCEPFLEVSWFLPLDFPLTRQFSSLDKKSLHCYGKILKSNTFANSNRSISSSFVYLHLVHDYDDQDKLFFCDQDQTSLQKVSWLIMKSDNYFVPSLFLIPSFEQELGNLFPRKETVFHFLGRYLLHPTNESLGGLKPWILYKPENRTVPDPPCCRVMSMEPCFHAPPFYDCKAKRGIDTGAVVPYVRHCEDMSWGLKLVDNESEL
ncbi:Galactoside 2-alpha-L-fucosyltransferase [Hibiscus syriacus]|uniref:Fucosyltransferase n=1 Tax=Hibiscus syriacus TaxID=106335 RepID=A0A6A2YDQ3_HIBSY|nr:Galactoside 2-alpha-L-fucosyltransferase [Hibiscus syriacus]